MMLTEWQKSVVDQIAAMPKLSGKSALVAYLYFHDIDAKDIFENHKELLVEKAVKCRHIIGFDEGYGTPSGEDAIEYESPKLVYIDGGVKPTLQFKHCPLCAGLI